MNSFIDRLKGFLAWLWSKIVRFGRWILTAILLAVIIIVGIVIARDNSDSSSSDTASTRPEVAQVFEPSIGTPLPADTKENSTTPPTITPESTTPTPTSTQEQPSPSGSVAGATTTYTAPQSGVDPRKPVVYKNSNYHFTATLPARSSVTDEGNLIGFFNNKGRQLYTVSIQPNSENLSIIEAQLRNSPEVNNIQFTKFNNLSALSFTYGNASGLVFLKNGTAFYLIGQKSYFSQFKI